MHKTVNAPLCYVLTKRHFALSCGTKRLFAMTKIFRSESSSKCDISEKRHCKAQPKQSGNRVCTLNCFTAFTMTDDDSLLRLCGIHSLVIARYEAIRKQGMYSGLLHCVRNDGRRQFASMGALTASNFVSKMSFFSVHRIITDLKSQIFITAGRDLRKKSTRINYLKHKFHAVKGRIFDCALSPTFQVVTGIEY
jgi:hypothetical protein